ncbi:acyltransferase family protein [Propionivibrio dicarboxylicus]|uniref:Peptidoglycan/LPS O-acetylase OafA/YrhL, contains acyltransferase and SGNH-hydrolase domains n=1 Tax=Propionivibrio dicarboxylicus TaxID=83767 RepID=A0A1G8IMF5_9RHOO|nr:acyltransferase [Propionivibrio dicarboxylicus]SDI20012.1 Peptidoglycan/LPS O-acetylase OafA/YrhL, contains acyltransferase and SGNH-hydrolase domains [Propionivibrio dicarboxylicus]
MQKSSPRLPFIDAFKAVASQLILLHHLALYGPLSEATHRVIPDIFGWLESDARIAVQVFLVIGGFLAANSLAPNGILQIANPLQQIKKRYFKLVIPFFSAVLFCVVASAIARNLLVDDAIPDRPTLSQLAAHATLLHGILGFDSLSAGVWYIAIDFQLFALLLGLLWLARSTATHRQSAVALLLVGTWVVASLFHFNRNADWDNWAIYFFGAYGLGALTFWMSQQNRRFFWLAGMALIVTMALAIDFRSRILIALVTALSLGLGQCTGLLSRWPNFRLLGWLGKISYSVFLIHFPLILLANALFSQLTPVSPGIVLSWTIGTWASAVLAGAFFFRAIESRSTHWQSLLTAPLKALSGHLFASER